MGKIFMRIMIWKWWKMRKNLENLPNLDDKTQRTLSKKIKWNHIFVTASKNSHKNSICVRRHRLVIEKLYGKVNIWNPFIWVFKKTTHRISFSFLFFTSLTISINIKKTCAPIHFKTLKTLFFSLKNCCIASALLQSTKLLLLED
jgi:hypothetical protein